MGPSRAHHGRCDEGTPFLRVSKHFVSRRQVLDAIARHSTMIFTTQTDLGFTPILLDQVQRSSVRSTEYDCRWDCTNHSLTFHRVKATSSRSRRLNSVVPSLIMICLLCTTIVRLSSSKHSEATMETCVKTYGQTMSIKTRLKRLKRLRTNLSTHVRWDTMIRPRADCLQHRGRFCCLAILTQRRLKTWSGLDPLEDL